MTVLGDLTPDSRYLPTGTYLSAVSEHTTGLFMYPCQMFLSLLIQEVPVFRIRVDPDPAIEIELF